MKKNVKVERLNYKSNDEHERDYLKFHNSSKLKILLIMKMK